MKTLVPLIIFLCSQAALHANLGVLNGVGVNQIPVPWSACNESWSLKIDVGRFIYENEGEDRVTAQSYLVAWRLNHNSLEYEPQIIKWYPGASHEISFVDLDGDGKEEMIVSYTWGAHTRVWDIFAPGENFEYGGDPFDSIGEIASDWGSIEILETKQNTYFVIQALDRNWEDQSGHHITEYEFVDGIYRQTSNKAIE